MLEYSLYSLCGDEGGKNTSLNERQFSEGNIQVIDGTDIEKLVQLLKSLSSKSTLKQPRKFCYFTPNLTLINDDLIVYLNPFEPVDKNVSNVVSFHATRCFSGNAEKFITESLGLQKTRTDNLLLVSTFHINQVTVELYHFNSKALVIAKAPFQISPAFLQELISWHKLHHSVLSS